jgi:hypothetical protein
MDSGSFQGCRTVHPPRCYLLQLKSGMDMNKAKCFGSPEYMEMVWRKLSLQQRVLELGYNFIFTARMICVNIF